MKASSKTLFRLGAAAAAVVSVLCIAQSLRMRFLIRGTRLLYLDAAVGRRYRSWSVLLILGLIILCSDLLAVLLLRRRARTESALPAAEATPSLPPESVPSGGDGDLPAPAPDTSDAAAHTAAAQDTPDAVTHTAAHNIPDAVTHTAAHNTPDAAAQTTAAHNTPDAVTHTAAHNTPDAVTQTAAHNTPDAATQTAAHNTPDAVTHTAAQDTPPTADGEKPHFCPACGKKAAPGSLFCQKCGTRLT